MNTENKVAIITGGANGIGLATAHRLSKAGICVVIADRDAQAGTAAESEIRGLGGEAFFVQTDVVNLDSVRALFASAEDRYGGVDILFNNAGVLGGPRFPDAAPSAWLKAIDVNLIGLMNGIYVGVPYLAKRGAAVIVNTASTAGLKASYLDPAYAMTKAGVVSLTRSLVFLKEESGIRINCVCPALVKTTLERNSGAEYDSDQLKAFLDGRVGRGELPSLVADDVAVAVMNLIEDDSLNGCACVLAVGEPWKIIPASEPQKV